MEHSAVGEGVNPPYPTRSPYKLDWDEGPQTLAELKAALLSFSPETHDRFVTELEECPFSPDGRDPLRDLRDTVLAYRLEWMALAHPLARAAIEESEHGPNDGVPADVVFADYDPVTYEPLDGRGRP
ncbi:hypothetical protein ACFVIM_05510 [Streptomyces sp. NPDC057638]|uniref:hypothetical protein n=1 Tax=Streptomyces sp. NPDC057638 TaxID=3346190 RepID=UPI0036BA9360